MSALNEKLTHALLIEAAAKWLVRDGCSIVITDMSHGGRETPDAIGWQNIYSTLIECKASVADYLADAHKFFRREPSQGMGNYRYFCTPPGLLAGRTLPPGWGLLEWNGKRMAKIQAAEKQRHYDGARQEISLLASAMRRLAGPRPQGISCRAYTIESKNRATLGLLPEGETELQPESEPRP